MDSLTVEQSDNTDSRVFDFIGVGFGPSNLAIAVAAEEHSKPLDGLFFEEEEGFDWHSGLLFENSRMQISFLKDLTTLRNPTSPYSFLAYTKSKGRLERFVNMSEFNPTRIEYQDYLRWVAGHFDHQVHYGRRVTSIVPYFGDSVPHYLVMVEESSGKRCSTHRAANIVVGTGGTARMPEALGSVDDSRIVHASRFKPHFLRRFADLEAEAEFSVVGDGQSSAEIALELLRKYPRAHVHILAAGYTLRCADRTPFVNEIFSSSKVNAFFDSDPGRRAMILRELRTTNYGAVSADLLEELYRHAYSAEVAACLTIHSYSRLIDAKSKGATDRLELTIQDRISQELSKLQCDGVVLATGYQRRLDRKVFENVLHLLKCDTEGNPQLTRHYRAETLEPTPCGLYVQGLGEASHGLGDSLLSLLPFRSGEITDDIVAHRIAVTDMSHYPPPRHLEYDEEILHDFVERHPFATMISARNKDDSVVTQVPLILDRSRGKKGILFGHIDASNPHSALLDSRSVVAIFHGPNTYITPLVYSSPQLPTWNSMSVHLWGRVRRLNDKAAVVRGLQSICEKVEPGPGAFRLQADDPRIEALIEGIMGFEIDIENMVGRFKLSQDRDMEDRWRAARQLMSQSAEGDRALIESALQSSCPFGSILRTQGANHLPENNHLQ